MELDSSDPIIRFEISTRAEDEFEGTLQLELLDRVEDILGESAVSLAYPWASNLTIISVHREDSKHPFSRLREIAVASTGIGRCGKAW